MLGVILFTFLIIVNPAALFCLPVYLHEFLQEDGIFFRQSYRDPYDTLTSETEKPHYYTLFKKAVPEADRDIPEGKKNKVGL